MLATGTTAPDFASTLDGKPFRLSDERGKRNVVLYFYPKDFTMGCTREACEFRDNYDEVQKYDAVILGVSADSAESHDAFREKHSLPFPLIPDPDKKVIKLYEVGGALFGFATARVTYVIDKQGVIRSAFRHDLAIGQHLTDVLSALRAIESVPAS